MMRLNAPITAILALAVLFFLPDTLFARPVHRASHKAAEPTLKSRSHRKALVESATKSRTTHRSKRHNAEKSARESAPSSPTISRINSSRRAHASRSRNPQLKRAVVRRTKSEVEAEIASHATRPKQATSADFLKAASVSADTPDTVPDTPRVDKALAIKAHSSEGDEKGRGVRASSSAATVPAKTPAPVVNVVRTTTEHPQLETVEDAAATPVILPTLYNKRGRLIVPPPLKGSREILLRQNQVADRDGLDRVQSDEDLLDMRNKKMLVALPVNGGMQVDDRLPVNRRYCRPWTAQFLATLARAHYVRFHTPLQVNSAVRTVEFQQHLLRINGNAAPAEGETASPHLTGQAIDLAKHGLSLTEIAWLRGYLLPLVQEGKVDVEEEFQQSCFHISVYKKYLPTAKVPRRNLASSRGDGTTALAAAIR